MQALSHSFINGESPPDTLAGDGGASPHADQAWRLLGLNGSSFSKSPGSTELPVVSSFQAWCRQPMVSGSMDEDVTCIAELLNQGSVWKVLLGFFDPQG